MTLSGRVLYLDDTNTNCKEEEREPFHTGELFPEKHHRECGRREDFHLIRHLEGCDGQV